MLFFTIYFLIIYLLHNIFFLFFYPFSLHIKQFLYDSINSSILKSNILQKKKKLLYSLKKLKVNTFIEFLFQKMSGL